jgi:hypothetical protein
MAITSMLSKVLNDGTEVTSYQVLDDISADESVSSEIEVLDAEAITLVVYTSAGVNAGVVLLEGAMTSAYAGTWLALGSITTAAASKAYEASISVGNGDPIVRYVRARIETAIGVGSVDAYINVRK